MKKIIFIILLTTSLNSCKKEKEGIHNQKTYVSKSFSIQYDIINLKKLNNNSFIIIDNKKILHNSDLYKIKNNNKLPSYKNIVLKVEDKKLEEKGNIVSIANKLYSILNLEKKYIFINKNKIDTQGTITFQRKDGKKIIIKHQEQYPVIIKKIE